MALVLSNDQNLAKTSADGAALDADRAALDADMVVAGGDAAAVEAAIAAVGEDMTGEAEDGAAVEALQDAEGTANDNEAKSNSVARNRQKAPRPGKMELRSKKKLTPSSHVKTRRASERRTEEQEAAAVGEKEGPKNGEEVNGDDSLAKGGDTGDATRNGNKEDPSGDAGHKEELKGKATGCFLKKSFGGTPFLGRVFRYDPDENWYRVRYEDGDLEDLTWSEIKDLLLPERANSATAKSVARMSPDRKAHLLDDTDGFEAADRRLAEESSPPPSRGRGQGRGSGKGRGRPRKSEKAAQEVEEKKSEFVEELSEDEDAVKGQESDGSEDFEDEVVASKASGGRRGRSSGRSAQGGGARERGRGRGRGKGTGRGRGRGSEGRGGGRGGRKSSGIGSSKDDFYYGDDYAEGEEDVWENIEDEEEDEEEETAPAKVEEPAPAKVDQPVTAIPKRRGRPSKQPTTSPADGKEQRPTRQSSKSSTKPKSSTEEAGGQAKQVKTKPSGIKASAEGKSAGPKPKGRTKSTVKQSIKAQAAEVVTSKATEVGKAEAAPVKPLKEPEPVKHAEFPSKPDPSPVQPEQEPLKQPELPKQPKLLKQTELPKQSEPPKQPELPKQPEAHMELDPPMLPVMRGRKKSSFRSGQAGALAMAGSVPPPMQKVEGGKRKASSEAGSGPFQKPWKGRKALRANNTSAAASLDAEEPVPEELVLEMTELGNEVYVVGADEEFHPGSSLVGKRVMKTFLGHLQRGSIIGFHPESKLYTIDYGGRGQEQLNWFLVEPILIIGTDTEVDPSLGTDIGEEASTYARSFNITGTDFEGI